MVACKLETKSRSSKRIQSCCKYSWIIIFGTATLLLLVMTIQRVDPDTRIGERSFQIIMPQLDVLSSACKTYQCSVMCVNSSSFVSEMLQAIEATGCDNIDTLHVDHQIFPNGILPKFWALANVNFFEILITNSNVSYVEPEAFDSDDFSQTLTLSMEGMPLTSLEGGTLLGLSKLESLTISAPIQRISRVFFQSIRATLKSVKMSRMTNEIQFDDLFGVCNMTNLVDVDLSNNKFTEPLTKIGFRKLSKVRYLDLSYSQISVIGRNAFDTIKDTLRFIDLSHNNLTTLAYDTLDSILESRRAYIYLRENNWVCDCGLIALVEYYEEYSEVFLDVPICRAPQEFYGDRINNVQICDVMPTFTTRSTSDATEISAQSSETTEKARSSDVDPSRGTDGGGYSTATTTDNPYTLSPCLTTPKSSAKSEGIIQYIRLQPATHDFSLKYLGDLTVQIDIVNYYEEITILWYNNPDTYGVQTAENDDCSKQTNGTMLIPGLRPNLSYVFCLIPKGKIAITPFNCLPFFIPPDKLEVCDAWLTVENKDIILILASIVFFITFIFGAIAAYVLIRNFPEIIRGNNRVLVVNKPREEKKPKVSIISANVDKKTTKRVAPPPPYKIFPEEDSSYEIPIEIVENEYLDEFQRCYAEPLHVCEETPITPPPLPKRNSTQIYSSKITRDIFTKRSI